MAHLSGRLATFLRQGGHLSVIVGIDLQNTTREGLKALSIWSSTDNPRRSFITTKPAVFFIRSYTYSAMRKKLG